MPTFIDESGDTGDLARGGKPYFRMAAVWIPTVEDVALFSAKVRDLRRRLGLRPEYEFKFSKTFDHSARRHGFFAAAMEIEFRFAISLLDKTNGHWGKASSKEQHWACATELSALLRPVFWKSESIRSKGLREPVWVDDNEDNGFLNILIEQFHAMPSRCHAGTRMIGKIEFSESCTSDGLQLADMVCGAVGSAIDHEDRRWYDMIRTRNVESDIGW